VWWDRLRATVSSPKMIQSIAALAIFGFLGAAVALLDFAPRLEASEATAFVKGDRPNIRSIAQNCSQQIWPNFDATCLRSGESGLMISEARLVTARR
jgi:hypothetical protein